MTEGSAVRGNLHFRFRTKLLAILGTTTLSFLTLIVVGSVLEQRTAHQLDLIAQRHIPQLELGPKLRAEFERLRQGLQDAVSAQDIEALHATSKIEASVLQLLSSAKAVLPEAQSAALREALTDYYRGAHQLSARLIHGETGESIVDDMLVMQQRQRVASELLDRVTAFDQGKLSQAFADAAQAQATTTRVRLAVSAGCLAAIVLLSLWVSRGVLRSLGAVGDGFVRFGQGDFETPIPSYGEDEFGELARRANQMAQNLKRLGDERDKSDWLKEGHAGLVLELRGGLEPATAASRAARHLARYLGAPAAALYWADADGNFRLLGHHATWLGGSAPAPLAEFRLGEGLVGQAARESELTVVHDVPEGYFPVRSGLGQARPQAIVLVPLIYLDKVSGILELAIFEPWRDSASELLLSVRETLAITIEVAQGRATLRRLLLETQQQAERLASQEDALRAKNEELERQQDELRRANRELMQQAAELETQRLSLEQSNAELQQMRRNLERKAQELTTVSAYKSRFLANMSHELRTPLNSMLLLSNLMAENREGNLNEKQVEFCRTMHGAGVDLLSLINQVLDLAKVESGRQEVSLSEVPLSQLTSHARRVFEPLARDKQLAFTIELDQAGLPDQIFTDGKRVEQILNNLLGNAIKFTSQGSVTLHIGRPGPEQKLGPALQREQTIALSVTDTGVGIPEEHQERVFAPFEQIEAAPDRRYGGTGLGLSIARELASLLGGELVLSSHAGRGSTFTLLLPFVHDANAIKARRSMSPSAEPITRTDLSCVPAPKTGDPTAGLDLLVIEDDPVFAELVGEVISAQGLKHRVAPDGHEGLELAKRCSPRGIILDVKLSDVDGFTVLEQLHADPATRAIPVHFVSALEGAERGLALGAIGYLTKPATRGDLAGVVQSLIRRADARICRLLVVEDDAELAQGLLTQLNHEGLEAHCVNNANAALALLADQRFSCLIVDLGLPDMDGLEFLQKLQQLRGSDMPPVLVYTGRPLDKAEVQRLEAYAEAVILKEGPAAERLLDEVRLFARRLAEGLPARKKPAPPPLSPQVRLEHRKILIADDDMRTVYALSALLRAKGAEVLVADTGRAALGLLAERPDVELVLMDIMMPEMDGFEAMRRIRQQPRFRTLPVIALTAKTMRIDREQCMQAGATDYMQKPIEPERLLGLLQARLPKLSEGVSHGVS